MPINRNQNSETDRATVPESTKVESGALGPRLIVVSGMMLGLQIAVGDEPVVIGRASECALALPHPSVSRQHCRIWREGEGFLIEDLGSTNHTFLNGRAVDRSQLCDGDQITVGSNAIKFFVGASTEADYHHELIDLAIYDSLTGFFNRRYFRTLLDEEVEKSAADAPVSLLMLDLDHFKQINDKYGHLVGDQVLASVAKIIREHAPAGVPIGRLGGEEFAMVVTQDAAAIAEKLRTAVAARTVETRDRQQLTVTISVGVARAGDGVDGGSGLLRRADEQLYRAKQNGRNRVCCAD